MLSARQASGLHAEVKRRWLGLPSLLHRPRQQRGVLATAHQERSVHATGEVCPPSERRSRTSLPLAAGVRLHESYEIKTFTYGSQVLHLLCSSSASTDYDLTGQLVWPGATLMNTYLSEHPETIKGRSILELGSGIGITGILCSRFCKEVVLTDHNDEVLEIIKKNIEMQSCSGNVEAVLTAEKLEWGNNDHISHIIKEHPVGFDLIVGADICFQQSSIPCLFDTVEKFLHMQAGKCRFILAYISRAKVMDALVLNEAEKRGMLVEEVDGTRTTIPHLQGVIFNITLK